jgi:hypothetical protein
LRPPQPNLVLRAGISEDIASLIKSLEVEVEGSIEVKKVKKIRDKLKKLIEA